MPDYHIKRYRPMELTEPRPRFQQELFADSFSATTGKDSVRQFMERLPEKAWYVWADGAVHLAIECPGWYERGKLYVLERKLEVVDG